MFAKLWSLRVQTSFERYSCLDLSGRSLLKPNALKTLFFKFASPFSLFPKILMSNDDYFFPFFPLFTHKLPWLRKKTQITSIAQKDTNCLDCAERHKFLVALSRPTVFEHPFSQPSHHLNLFLELSCSRIWQITTHRLHGQKATALLYYVTIRQPLINLPAF